MRAFAVRAALAALVLTTAVAVPAQAGPVTVAADGKVTIAAVNTPLGTLMDELARAGSIEILAFNPQARHVPVTVSLEGATFEQAVRTVLIASGATVAVGGLKNGPLRVHIGDVGEALPGQGLDVAAAGLGGGLRGEGEGNERVEARRRAAAEREKPAEEPAPPMVDTPGASDTIEVAAADGQPGYTMVGESVTYHDPNFVPYKNTEKAKAARRAVDVSKIP